jgi:Uma2 family endonuclease
VSIQPTLSIDPAWQRRLQLAEYHRMIDAGVFDEDDHLELLEGVLVAMSPQNPAHARAIEYLDWALQRSLGEHFRVRTQLPLTLPSFRSEPEPDLAVIDRRDGPWSRHPERALLVIEVADDSLRKDREAKARLYAAAGIPEYWIINCRDTRVEVFRGAGDGEYRESSAVMPGETLTCASLDGVSIPVVAIFADE